MTVNLDQNPTISDTIAFDIQTPDSSGCFSADPYMVNSVNIYFISRDITNGDKLSFNFTSSDPDLLQKLAQAKAKACILPNEINFANINSIQNQLNISSQNETFYFNQANVVKSFGTTDFPAWLSTDQSNAILDHITVAPDGGAQYGFFQLQWTPNGMREGDYFICWSWSPLPAGDVLYSYQYFALAGNTAITTSIPTHRTVPGKYKKLLERYTPEMFKAFLSSADLSPYVIQGLNNSVAEGFSSIEDQSNQIIDLIDANATSETFLPVLGNTFGLTLKSTDPTLWRRQIKKAIPLFKKKGTMSGLIEAMSQAGIKLHKYTRLWQVVSQYTYQEAFNATNGQTNFDLKFAPILPIDHANFELYYRKNGTNAWISESSATLSDKTLTWTGITLSSDDWIRVIYEVNVVPAPKQAIETYIRTLDLADQRDERTFNYPLKNWNVRVIAEDDPMFSSVIPTINPFYDPVVYGMIRTEFPYSENVYNMDTYNGSARESIDPCHIDLNFLDYCSGGPSSKYTIDVEVSNLSNNRLMEVKEILAEFTPFHSVLHSMNIYGSMEDFIYPQDSIETLVYVSGEENMIVDSPQLSFHRSMDPGKTLFRDASLNSYSPSIESQAYPTSGTATGTAANTEIVLFYPAGKLSDLPIDPVVSLTYLEVLSPSPNSGAYTIDKINGKNATLESGSPSNPLNQSAFTFRISNEVIRATTGSVARQDIYTLSGNNITFEELGIKTVWDVDNDPSYTGGPWQVVISSVSYDILNTQPDNSLIVNTIGLSAGSVSYQIKTDIGALVASSTGILVVKPLGLVNLGSSVLVRGDSTLVADIDNIQDIMSWQTASNGFGYYCLVNGIQYSFNSFSGTKQFLINYSLGNVSGVDLVIYQRILDMATGYFFFNGQILTAGTNIESFLGILNGSNPPSDPNLIVESGKFIENYLVEIGSDYYVILGINNNLITLSGPKYDWTLAGTSVQYRIQHFANEETFVPSPSLPEDSYIPGIDYQRLDRRGGNMIQVVETGPSMMSGAHAKLIKEKPNMEDILKISESITYTIEYAEEEK